MSTKKGFDNSDSYIGYETVIEPNKKIKHGQAHPEIGKIRAKFLKNMPSVIFVDLVMKMKKTFILMKPLII